MRCVYAARSDLQTGQIKGKTWITHINGSGLFQGGWIICCGLHSHQIATQLNTDGSFWSDVLRQRSPPPSSKHQMREWWKNGVHPSCRVQRLVESLPKSAEAVLVALRHFMLVFPIICHLSVIATHFIFFFFACFFSRNSNKKMNCECITSVSNQNAVQLKPDID